MYKASLTHVNRGLQHVQSVVECEGWSGYTVTLVSLTILNRSSVQRWISVWMYFANWSLHIEGVNQS